MKIGIVGGTGIDACFPIVMDCIEVHTPYGSVQLYVGTGDDADLVFLPRHGLGHSLPPHLINYRANIWALKQLGVQRAVGLYAVGSISDLVPPGSWGLCDQFIDMTGGAREHTFFTGGDNGVRHVSMNHPYDLDLNRKIAHVAKETLDEDVPVRGTYVCTNGPRLETPAEINMFRLWGGDVVGMTGSSEAILAKEADIAFCCASFSINWAAGLEDESVSFIGDEQIQVLTHKIVAASISALRGA